MDESLRTSHIAREGNAGVCAECHFEGITESQLAEYRATKQRADRLYEMGELRAAARLLGKLAVYRHACQTGLLGPAFIG